MSFADGDRLLLAIADSAGTLTTDVSVLLLSSQGAGDQELVDANAQSALRVLNTVVAAAGIDVVIDDDFGAPLHSAVLPDTVTSFASLAPGGRNLKVTPTGDTSTIELDENISINPGLRLTVLLAGDLGSVTGAQGLDDIQRLPGVAKLRIYSGATNEGNVNVYIVPPGSELADNNPVVPNFPVGVGNYLQFLPDDYEIAFAEPGTTNEIGTRVPITLAGGELYGVVVLDDSTTRVRVLLIDDFVP